MQRKPVFGLALLPQPPPPPPIKGSKKKEQRSNDTKNNNDNNNKEERNFGQVVTKKYCVPKWTATKTKE